jgi:hypothetical protein
MAHLTLAPNMSMKDTILRYDAVGGGGLATREVSAYCLVICLLSDMESTPSRESNLGLAGSS